MAHRSDWWWLLVMVGILMAPVNAAVPEGAEEEVAVIETSMGTIVWRFLPDQAPGHVAFVKQLIRSGFYDGTTFHRVIPGFVVQGGDPLSKNADRRDDGEGEADHRLKAEFSDKLHYRPGTVGMARENDPDSGSCQFFIALLNLPRLDGRYTIFAETIEGLSVARKIAEQPRDLQDNPLARITVQAHLEKRRVPDKVYSLGAEPAEAGTEFLTGPGRPRFWDPGNLRWSRPAPMKAGAGGLPRARLELVVDEAGQVVDVRFPDVQTPAAEELRRAALKWTFAPFRFDGKAQKTRFEIDSDLGNAGGPTCPGAPVTSHGDVTPAHPVLRVPLPAGKPAGVAPVRLRLTIGADGKVVEAWAQGSTGDPDLDRAAELAAKEWLFSPALVMGADGKKEPTISYSEIEAQFRER